MTKDKKPRNFCQGCFEKQIENDRLKQEVIRLKALLRYQERTAKEGFFGSSTPSSKVPVKANATKQKQDKQGGARAGHKGYGRKSVNISQADRIEYEGNTGACPDCGGRLKESKGRRSRTVIDIQPIKLEKILYEIRRRKCMQCGRTFQGKVPGVLPRSLFGNELLTYIAVQHYIYGIPLGRLEAQFGIGIGSIIGALHRLGRLFKDVPNRLIQDYRQSPVRHADETGWRNDGRSGYSWLFCTDKISIFRFRGSRSSKIPHEIFGSDKLSGILVVDRYNAYNKVPCALQYCYAHLLREVEDAEKEFPDSIEVEHFVSNLAPLLAQAMHLRSQDISNRAFYRKALLLKRKILKIVCSPANHPAIQRIQDIFRNNDHRMYHWCKNRKIPAENNRVERELRPTVIARKVSFGSQSDEGAKTREILMTVLHTLKKRGADFGIHFKSALDSLSVNSAGDPYQLLYPPDT